MSKRIFDCFNLRLENLDELNDYLPIRLCYFKKERKKIFLRQYYKKRMLVVKLDDIYKSKGMDNRISRSAFQPSRNFFGKTF